jgi:hypothetical protein
MKVETFQCDVCGTLKRESNHWWMSAEANGMLTIVPLGAVIGRHQAPNEAGRGRREAEGCSL